MSLLVSVIRYLFVNFKQIMDYFIKTVRNWSILVHNLNVICVYIVFDWTSTESNKYKESKVVLTVSFYRHTWVTDTTMW